MSNTLFKRAVSWTIHLEPEEFIREDLGFTGDMDEVRELAELIKQETADMGNASYNFIHTWANS